MKFKQKNTNYENYVKIFNAIDFSLLRSILIEPYEWFERYGTITVAENGQRYIHIERGGNVLGVAHLDTVQGAPTFSYNPKKGIIRSPYLDDRIGAFIFLELLPRLGITCDVLLTDDEESGRSSGRQYADVVKDAHPYNWMMMFDRTGDDVVLYEYSDGGEAWRTALTTAGFRIGVGSFSCISGMQEMKVKGVNIGVGYHDYHSKNAYLRLKEMIPQVNRLLKFYEVNKDIKFEHTPVQYTTRLYSSGGWYSYYDDYDGGVYPSTTTSSYSKYMKNRKTCALCGSVQGEKFYYHVRKINSPTPIGVCFWCHKDITEKLDPRKSDVYTSFKHATYEVIFDAIAEATTLVALLEIKDILERVVKFGKETTMPNLSAANLIDLLDIVDNEIFNIGTQAMQSTEEGRECLCCHKELVAGLQHAQVLHEGQLQDVCYTCSLAISKNRDKYPQLVPDINIPRINVQKLVYNCIDSKQVNAVIRLLNKLLKFGKITDTVYGGYMGDLETWIIPSIVALLTPSSEDDIDDDIDEYHYGASSTRDTSIPKMEQCAICDAPIKPPRVLCDRCAKSSW